HLERSTRQADVNPGCHRLGVETRLRHAGISRRLKRLSEQPLDRLVPITRAVHDTFLSTRVARRLKKCAVLPQSTPRALSVFFSAVSAGSAVNGFFTGCATLVRAARRMGTGARGIQGLTSP